MNNVDYLILGAGISGLAAGQKLKENEKNFLILEKIILMVGYVIILKSMDFFLIDLYTYHLRKIKI